MILFQLVWIDIMEIHGNQAAEFQISHNELVLIIMCELIIVLIKIYIFCLIGVQHLIIKKGLNHGWNWGWQEGPEKVKI